MHHLLGCGEVTLRLLLPDEQLHFLFNRPSGCCGAIVNLLLHQRGQDLEQTRVQEKLNMQYCCSEKGNETQVWYGGVVLTASMYE